jgi:hypothetical protein
MTDSPLAPSSLARGSVLRPLLFFWSSSLVLAVGVYYLLWLVMPGHYVFGLLYRMFLYHWGHPVQYILIPCFVFGLVATALLGRFARQTATWRRVAMTLLIVVVTVIASSPFGGMLWHLHDMLYGFFPPDWFHKMFVAGAWQGLTTGWAVVLLSVPYNVIGTVACFFLLREGARRFGRQPP